MKENCLVVEEAKQFRRSSRTIQKQTVTIKETTLSKDINLRACQINSTTNPTHSPKPTMWVDSLQTKISDKWKTH